MTNRIEEKLKEFQKENEDVLNFIAKEYPRRNRDRHIYASVEKALTDLIKELEDKVVGEEKKMPEGVDIGFGRAMRITGYNQKRNEVQQAFKEFN